MQAHQIKKKFEGRSCKYFSKLQNVQYSFLIAQNESFLKTRNPCCVRVASLLRNYYITRAL